MADRASSSSVQDSRPVWQTSLFWIVLIAFAIRLAFIVLGHTYKFKTVDDNFGFGFEMGRIGRSIAMGQGFSSPFGGSTGPTAWEPPIYPYLIAGVFKVFGIYSRPSAIVLLAINSCFASLTCIPIFMIAARCFNQRVALWTAWVWALLPNIIYWSTRWIWETSIAAFLLALIFYLTLVLEERDGVRPWIEFGLLWGLAALLNTSLLSFLPASGLWIWYRRAKVGKSSFRGVAIASLVFCIMIAPWIIRNQRVFGQFIFIRSNFGEELRLGNGPGATGLWMDYLHPTKNAQEFAQYRQMGELAYVAERKREALAFIREDRLRFIRLSLRRFVFYWDGLPHGDEKSKLAGPAANAMFLASTVLAIWGLARALRLRRSGAWLFLWLIVFVPAVYYFTFPEPRYRHPIEPELAILIVYVISEARWKR